MIILHHIKNKQTNSLLWIKKKIYIYQLNTRVYGKKKSDFIAWSSRMESIGMGILYIILIKMDIPVRDALPITAAVHVYCTFYCIDLQACSEQTCMNDL